MSLDPSQAVKALGIHWDAANDFMFYTVNLPNTRDAFTKRLMLSEISKLFDPLSLLGPVIVLGKILIQQLWKGKISWDTPVPREIQEFWINYRQQLQLLNNVKFNRYILTPNAIEIQSYGFCDASKKAYGACLYMRSTNKDGMHSAA